ncbi:unnamed protein product [Echinostoma caproni]|uniref:Phage portal protein n=1 Tax=Echinostoma caproni TaxID=27848 RepID=A0A183AU90_9TREM|nr:unnamed protein product [Echinostoma caproni]
MSNWRVDEAMLDATRYTLSRAHYGSSIDDSSIIKAGHSNYDQGPVLGDVRKSWAYLNENFGSVAEVGALEVNIARSFLAQLTELNETEHSRPDARFITWGMRKQSLRLDIDDPSVTYAGVV